MDWQNADSAYRPGGCVNMTEITHCNWGTMPDPSDAGVAGFRGVIGAGVIGQRLEFDCGACKPIFDAGVKPGVTLPGVALLPGMLGVPGEAV